MLKLNIYQREGYFYILLDHSNLRQFSHEQQNKIKKSQPNFGFGETDADGMLAVKNFLFPGVSKIRKFESTSNLLFNSGNISMEVHVPRQQKSPDNLPLLLNGDAFLVHWFCGH